MNLKPKTLVVVGPTSSGKSELAVKLAKRFNGEIISCDSRQVYKGMDIGTGKVTGKWQALPFTGHPEQVHPREGSLKSKRIFVYKSIPHHLIDFVNPKSRYSAAQFQKAAQKVIADILKRGKLPILCGGTGHWIDAVIYNQAIPEVRPNLKLRAKLEKQTVDDLFKQLKKLDPVRAASIDRHNPRRLIRALEIVITTGKPVPPLQATHSTSSGQASYPFDKLRAGKLQASPVLWLGINPPQDILFAKIKKRLKQRLAAGMIKEVKKLRNQGMSWKRLQDFGLEYRFCSLYLQNKLEYNQMFDQLLLAIEHYSKRQLTWWKKNKEIHWIKNYSEAAKLVNS